MRIVRWACAAVSACAASAAVAGTPTPLKSELFVDGLTLPTFLTHAPGDFTRQFIIEKPGRIRVVENGTLLATPFLDIAAQVGGGTDFSDERGLLGLAFHPDYQTNGRFFVYYTDVNSDSAVSEFAVSADPNVADDASENILLTIDQPQTNHNAGWMDFGPDGYLYIASGDGGNRDDTGSGHVEGGNAQDIEDNLLGKLLRIDVDTDDFPGDPLRDYGIPPDNPFAGVAGDDEIWAYGLRNPWRPSFDRETGDLWIADVGQDLIEEINFQPAGIPGGRNYGWRCMEGDDCTGLSGCTCFDAALTGPIYTYPHSQGCSITGGYVYRGCAIPDLQGTYFFSDFCSRQIWTFRYDGTSISEFQNRTSALAIPLDIQFIVSFGEDAYGELYIVSNLGGIYKVVPDTDGAVVGADCNSNGINDDCELLDGSQSDVNGNGVLDVCEPGCPNDPTGTACDTDVTGDCVVNNQDLGVVLAAYLSVVGDPEYNPVVNFDDSGSSAGRIDNVDLGEVLADYLNDCN